MKITRQAIAHILIVGLLPLAPRFGYAEGNGSGQSVSLPASYDSTITILTKTINPDTVITSLRVDTLSREKPVGTAGNAPICEGQWTGSPNNISFTVVNQSKIDPFKIVFRNLGACTKVEVQVSPVTISGRTFTVNFNIPTISTGSLTGTFSADGNSVSGTYTYKNNNCGSATKSGSWSGSAVTPCVQAPTAGFTASPTSGVRPLMVQFTDQSTGDITSWSWDFGDGGTSSQQNPSHTYTSAGTYTVRLTVTGPGGSDTKRRRDYITVTEPAPVADFTGSPTSGPKPLTVHFTDQSTGNIANWDWDFGDGGTSTQQNPSHTYTEAG
ncbi:MAG: PKD domain-containing protein, partial [Bacteroidetes bacterium]